MGLDDTIRFSTEVEYNPKSSALIWCARALALALALACPFFDGPSLCESSNLQHDIDQLRQHVNAWRKSHLLKTLQLPVAHLLQ